MVAQSTERSSATTSAAAASSYGAAGTADALANGVPAHERQQQVNGTMGTQELENPNLHDPAPPPDPRVDASNVGQASALQPVQADPSYEELHQGVNVVRTGVLPTEATTPATEQAEHPTTPANSTVTVQEYFSAESRTATNEQQGVRWMARFTEFLRTKANRGASGVDRVLDGLGIPPIHPESHQGFSLCTDAKDFGDSGDYGCVFPSGRVAINFKTISGTTTTVMGWTSGYRSSTVWSCSAGSDATGSVGVPPYLWSDFGGWKRALIEIASRSSTSVGRV